MPPTHARSHFLTNTGYIGSIPKEGKPGKLFFLPVFSVESHESWRPPSFHVLSLICFPGLGDEVLCPPRIFGSQMYTLISFRKRVPSSHAGVPAFSWAVCHGGEVRRHVILQWCVERVQPGLPRHRMTTNQTGFQQHEKYIDPSARLEMASYTV